MSIPFRCTCGAAYLLRDEFAGRILHCPRCGKSHRVGPPATASAPDRAPPEAPEAIPTITDDMLVAEPEAPPAASDQRVDFERGMPLAPPLTLLLIGGNILLFFLTLAKGALESPEAVVLAGALTRDRVLAGEVWRLVSSLFLHGGLDHLFGNCVALYVLGMACEHAYGLPRTAILYLLAGIGASSLSALLSPGPSVGASGAIFGLMAAAIVFFRRFRERFVLRDTRLGVVLMVWAAYSILTGLVQPLIDNGAHVGGLAAGALVALAVRPAILDRIAASGAPPQEVSSGAND